MSTKRLKLFVVANMLWCAIWIFWDLGLILILPNLNTASKVILIIATAIQLTCLITNLRLLSKVARLDEEEEALRDEIRELQKLLGLPTTPPKEN